VRLNSALESRPHPLARFTLCGLLHEILHRERNPASASIDQSISFLCFLRCRTSWRLSRRGGRSGCHSSTLPARFVVPEERRRDLLRTPSAVALPRPCEIERATLYTARDKYNCRGVRAWGGSRKVRQGKRERKRRSIAIYGERSRSRAIACAYL